MLTGEILPGYAMQHGSRRCAQAVFEYLFGIRTGDGMQCIETHAEFPICNKCPNAFEIEQPFQCVRVMGDRIDDINGHSGQGLPAGRIDVDAGCCIQYQIAVDVEAALINGVGQRFRRLAAVGDVELDAEITFRAAGVVAGSKDEAASGSHMGDH